MDEVISLEQLTELYRKLRLVSPRSTFYTAIWSDHADFEAHLDGWVSDHRAVGYPMDEYEKDQIASGDFAPIWKFICSIPVEVSAPVVAAMNDFVAEKYDTKAASGTARAASGRHIDTGLIEGLYDVIGGPLFESVWDQAEGLGAAFVAWAEQNEPKAFADWSEQWSASKRAAAQSDPRWMYAALEEKVRNGSAESMVRFVNALPDTEAARAVSAIHAVYAAGEKKKIKATTKPKAKPAPVTKAKPKTAKKPAKAAGKKKAPTKKKAASAPAGRAKTKRKT